MYYLVFSTDFSIELISIQTFVGLYKVQLKVLCLQDLPSPLEIKTFLIVLLLISITTRLVFGNSLPDRVIH